MHTESVGKLANEMIYFILSLSVFPCFFSLSSSSSCLQISTPTRWEKKIQNKIAHKKFAIEMRMGKIESRLFQF